MADSVTLRSDTLAVVVAAAGAELQSITDAQGGEWLWDGDPRWWTGRAPILFPTVGVTAGGIARFDGRDYPLGKHGFARDSRFAIVAKDDDMATFRLEADDRTRAVYPFDFRLDVTYALGGNTLTTTAEVRNLGDAPMPAGFGFHPALRWPLPGTAAARTDHFVRFDADEPEPLRAITGEGLFAAAPRATPVHDNELHLHDDLFAHDALVWDRPNSRGLYYGVEDHPGVRVDFAGMPMLGIWTKPGAGYLCIEPWHSHADEEGFAGDFADKPGVVTIAPGDAVQFAMALTIGVRLD